MAGGAAAPGRDVRGARGDGAAAGLGARERAATRIHENPRLALEVESASVRSRYSVAFDQAHVKANKVVQWREGEEREEYYRPRAAYRRSS